MPFYGGNLPPVGLKISRFSVHAAEVCTLACYNLINEVIEKGKGNATSFIFLFRFLNSVTDLNVLFGCLIKIVGLVQSLNECSTMPL